MLPPIFATLGIGSRLRYNLGGNGLLSRAIGCQCGKCAQLALVVEIQEFGELLKACVLAGGQASKSLLALLVHAQADSSLPPSHSEPSFFFYLMCASYCHGTVTANIEVYRSLVSISNLPNELMLLIV